MKRVIKSISLNFLFLSFLFLSANSSAAPAPKGRCYASTNCAGSSTIEDCASCLSWANSWRSPEGVCYTSCPSYPGQSYFQPTDCMPPVGGTYQSFDCRNFSTTGGPYQLCSMTLTSFSTCTVPPAPIPSTMTTIGFLSNLNCQLQIGTHAVPGVPGELRLTYTGSNGPTKTYTAELRQLDVQGGTLPPNVRLRESPTLASMGTLHITNFGGLYYIDSFFDVFMELSSDGGATWAPAQEGAMSLDLQPSTPSNIPTLSEWGLIALGVLALGMGLLFVRRINLI